MLMVRILRRCALPFISVMLIVIFYGAYVTKVREGLKISWYQVTDKVFFIVAIVVLAYWITSIATTVLSWYGDRIALKTKTTLDDDFMPLTRKLVGVIIWLVALVIILNYMGVNINALIATLGVGSLAVALAAQDTIANIIAGFLIIIDRPFKVGDDIMLSTGDRVTVLKIGNRRSKFRAQDGSIIIMPNLDLSKSKIVNFTYGKSNDNDRAIEKGGRP